MYRISVTLSLIALAAFVNAAIPDDDSCGGQHAASFMCIVDLKKSDEAKLIMDKKKQICTEVCAKDYPKSCIADWEAMESCCAELTAKAKMLDDPECVALMNKTVSDANKCFETEPSNPLADLEMLFMPPMMHPHMDKGPMKGMMMKGKGGPMGGGKAGEKGKSDEKKSNGTSSSSEEDDSGMPHPPPELHIRKECMKTPEQHKCIEKELVKAMKDDKFSKAVASLMKKKDDCEDKVQPECDISTKELGMCFMEAHKDLFKKIMEKMDTCMKGKTGGGSGSDAKDGDKKSDDNSTTPSPAAADSKDKDNAVKKAPSRR